MVRLLFLYTNTSNHCYFHSDRSTFITNVKKSRRNKCIKTLKMRSRIKNKADVRSLKQLLQQCTGVHCLWMFREVIVIAWHHRGVSPSSSSLSSSSSAAAAAAKTVCRLCHSCCLLRAALRSFSASYGHRQTDVDTIGGGTGGGGTGPPTFSLQGPCCFSPPPNWSRK